MKPKPVTKWAGGKKALLPEIRERVPDFERYIEPFVGGGALLFDLMPGHAVINDSNYYLTTAYQVIKNQPNELIELLKIHKEHNSEDYYYNLRSVDRDGRIDNMNDVAIAARFLYMQKVNYNGLYRVNRKGQNNTPYGKYKDPDIVQEENILAVSKYFNENKITILNDDFEKIIQRLEVTSKDFIYFDPPYIPISETSAFTSYTADGFTYEDQVRLRDLFIDCSHSGAKVLLSNSSSELVYELYGGIDGVQIDEVKVGRAINSNGTKRGKINETLIRNY